MSAALLTLDAGRGEAVTYTLTHVASATDSTPVNISGWTILVSCKKVLGGATAIFSAKTATVTSGPAGTYTFSIAAADTMQPPGTYQIDIWRTDSGSETLMGIGTLTIRPTVKN